MSYRLAMEAVLEDVRHERANQFQKWGTQRPDWPVWLAILMEEVGESAEAALKLQFEGEPIEQLHDEMVQVAAVAVAILEHIEEVIDTTKRDA